MHGCPEVCGEDVQHFPYSLGNSQERRPLLVTWFPLITKALGFLSIFNVTMWNKMSWSPGSVNTVLQKSTVGSQKSLEFPEFGAKKLLHLEVLPEIQVESKR